jgi:hypothetical protein
MGMVMIRCPETGRAVSTDRQVDRATFHSTPVFFSGESSGLPLPKLRMLLR